jgi:hypothetical protein
MGRRRAYPVFFSKSGGLMIENRKYFGMTTSQLAILGGLAAAACLVFGAAGWFVFRGGFNFSRSPANTPVPQATSTSFVIPTITPTLTSTPIPYEQLIPNGWTQYRTALVELWLPSGFTSTSSGVSGVSGNSVLLEMALIGATSDSSAYKMFVTVSFEPLTSDSLDEFVDTRLSNIPADVNMAERRKILINSTEAYRLMFEGHNNNVSTNDLLFVFQDGSVIWYVRYSAEIKEFYEMLSTFEQSVKTFRIVR